MKIKATGRSMTFLYKYFTKGHNYNLGINYHGTDVKFILDGKETNVEQFTFEQSLHYRFADDKITTLIKVDTKKAVIEDDN